MDQNEALQLLARQQALSRSSVMEAFGLMMAAQPGSASDGGTLFGYHSEIMKALWRHPQLIEPTFNFLDMAIKEIQGEEVLPTPEPVPVPEETVPGASTD